MVGAEDAALAVDVLEQDAVFRGQLLGPQHRQLAALDPVVQRRAGVDAKRQHGNIVRLDARERLRRLNGVDLALLLAAHAVDRGDGGDHPGGLGAQRVLDDLLHGHALVILFQQRLVAGFQPDVDHGKAALAQCAQLLVRLAHDRLGGGVGAHALALGEVFVDIVQHLQQIVHRQDQRVAVGQEDALDAAVKPTRLGQVREHLLDRVDGKLLVLVHDAEGALVVAAAQRALHDQAVGLAGGTVNASGIMHSHSPCRGVGRMIFSIISYRTPEHKPCVRAKTGGILPAQPAVCCVRADTLLY